MNTPIFIPIPSHSEPERCPQCNRLENIKQVCRECGYEYPEDEGEFHWWYILIIVLVIAIILWGGITLMEWLFGWDNKSLVEILVDQWNWIRSRRIF